MTLIIGLRCEDGLVMAADSMATEAAPDGQPITKHETSKKITIHRELMWGCSGSVGVRQVVDEDIAAHYDSIFRGAPTPVELRKRLIERIHPLLKEHYEWTASLNRAASASDGRPRRIQETNFLFGTYLREHGFALINIEWNTNGEVVQADFCATGSGMKTATALLGRLRNQAWDVRTALAVAYRTMNDAIHVEPGGIGHPICLATAALEDGGKAVFRRIRPETPQYKEVGDTTRVWMGMEQEALAALLKGAEEDADEGEPVPHPEASSK